MEEAASEAFYKSRALLSLARPLLAPACLDSAKRYEKTEAHL